MDASRSNSPSRKSRFRSQSGAAYRPTGPAEEALPETEEESPVYAEGEVYEDGVPVEPEAADYPPAEIPPDESYHAAETASAETLPADAPTEEDSLPAGYRLTRSTENLPVRRRGVPGWVFALVSLLCLAMGGLGGYFSRSNATVASTSPTGPAATAHTGPILALAPAVLAEVDAAFVANKQGQFADARKRFDALAEQHPDWVSMRIEAARTTMYEHDFEAAERSLNTIQRAGANVDAEFLMGLLQMTTQTYDKSDAAFTRAIALDPTRADVFYFWGESLRRQGKPQDAADKFRQALIRNQYETTEGLYQLKLWLSEIQADQEKAKGTIAKIDEDLASGHPSGPALFAAAAREIKDGKFKEAGAHVGQAQKVMEPAVFRVVLQDPTFLQENFRPEFAPYFQP